MWRLFLLVGILVSLLIVILYSALVVASDADDQSEEFLSEIKKLKS